MSLKWGYLVLKWWVYVKNKIDLSWRIDIIYAHRCKLQSGNRTIQKNTSILTIECPVKCYGACYKSSEVWALIIQKALHNHSPISNSAAFAQYHIAYQTPAQIKQIKKGIEAGLQPC